jgi:hypothetical protein
MTYPGSNLLITLLLVTTGLFGHAFPQSQSDSLTGIRKVKDVVIYEDSLYYAAFPSVVRLKNGELLLAFRRAPERRAFGEEGNNHVDPNSFLVSVRSRDSETWTPDPDLIYAHAFGGSQDPYLLRLRDGTLLCTSYGWAFLRGAGLSNLKQPAFQNAAGSVFLGDTWCDPPTGDNPGRGLSTLPTSRPKKT